MGRNRTAEATEAPGAQGSKRNTDKRGVRKGSDTSIELDFYYKDVRCRERLKLAPTPTNLRYADRLKKSIELEIGKGEFNYAAHFPDSPRARALSQRPGDAITVASYLDGWLKRSRKYIKASTWAGYSKIIRGALIPAFGELKLTQLTRPLVKEWITGRDATAKTIGNLISPLRCALDEAVEDNVIEVNPLAGWKIKRRRSTSPRQDNVDPFSGAERSAILGALDGQAKNFVEFAFWTGMRTSELVALDWTDVDFIKGVVHVTRAWTQCSEEPEEPKTKAGAREVRLLAPALEALKRQKAYTFLAGKEIFQNPRTSERWAGDQPIRKSMWTPALKKAGVHYRNPYQTRHSFASMMLMAGESAMWVAATLGHVDWAFTARTYSRFIPSDAPEAGSKAVELWSRSGQL